MKSSNGKNNDPSVVLFDGVCNFCNSSIRFVLHHDSRKRFRFGALQSDAGRNHLKNAGWDPSQIFSIILIEEGNVFTQSTAVLRIAKHLHKPWCYLYYLIYLPQALRDFVYNVIAKHRYQWFGKQKECMVPSPEWKDRFIN